MVTKQQQLKVCKKRKERLVEYLRSWADKLEIIEVEKIDFRVHFGSKEIDPVEDSIGRLWKQHEPTGEIKAYFTFTEKKEEDPYIEIRSALNRIGEK